MDTNITQHFRKDEIPFLKYCEDLINRVQDEYRFILTDFLNPRQAYLLRVMVNSYQSTYLKLFGGLTSSEMKRGIIYPRYFHPVIKDFQIALIQIKYPVKFVSIRHSQILGTLMGTGINRYIIGDILTDGKHWQFTTETRMVPYLESQISRIGRTTVELKSVPLSKIVKPISDWHDYCDTVASLRIDSLIASAFNISRTKAKQLVKHNRVRLNWELFDRPDYDVGINDILSIRHFGRVKLKSVNGRSRKGKLKIVASVLKK